MNCQRCHAPLDGQARFCRVCGLPVPPDVVDIPPAHTQSPVPALNDAPTLNETLPTPPLAQTQWSPPFGSQPTQMPSVGQQTPREFPQRALRSEPPYTPPGAQAVVGSMQSVGTLQPGVAKKRSRMGSCLLRLAIALLVVAALLVGGWFLALRPFVHNLAQGQIDATLTDAANKVIPIPPAVQSIQFTEELGNNIIQLAHSPSDPVQNEILSIAQPVFANDGSYTGGVQFSFTVYGFPSAITLVPAVDNGGIVMTHVKIDGIISWIYSPDELTSTLNTHFQTILSRTLRQVTAVTIKDQEIDIQLGTFTLP